MERVEAHSSGMRTDRSRRTGACRVRRAAFRAGMDGGTGSPRAVPLSCPCGRGRFGCRHAVGKVFLAWRTCDVDDVAVLDSHCFCGRAGKRVVFPRRRVAWASPCVPGNCFWYSFDIVDDQKRFWGFCTDRFYLCCRVHNWSGVVAGIFVGASVSGFIAYGQSDKKDRQRSDANVGRMSNRHLR